MSTKHVESLSYVCVATKQRHNAKGFVYRNRWETGAEDLIFASHQDAEKWANRRGGFCLYHGPRIAPQSATHAALLDIAKTGAGQ